MFENIKLEVGRKSQSQFGVAGGKGRKSQFAALKGRKLKAQGNALCNECDADFVAPLLAANYGDVFAWGKIADTEDCSRIKTVLFYFTNKKLNSNLSISLFQLRCPDFQLLSSYFLVIITFLVGARWMLRR